LFWKLFPLNLPLTVEEQPPQNGLNIFKLITGNKEKHKHTQTHTHTQTNKQTNTQTNIYSARNTYPCNRK